MNPMQDMIVKMAKKMTKEQKAEMLKKFEERYKDHPDKEKLIAEMKNTLEYEG